VGPAAVCGGRQRTQTEELGTSRSHFELLTVSAGPAAGADRGIGYISKPLRVVNGQFSTSRHLDNSTTRLLDEYKTSLSCSGRRVADPRYDPPKC